MSPSGRRSKLFHECQAGTALENDKSLRRRRAHLPTMTNSKGNHDLALLHESQVGIHHERRFGCDS